MLLLGSVNVEPQPRSMYEYDGWGPYLQETKLLLSWNLKLEHLILLKRQIVLGST